MSIENFIRAIPKAELNIQLEGAINPKTLTMIAEQNDIPSTFKTLRQYESAVKSLHQHTSTQIDEVARNTAAWLRYPEDIARVVYELGVALSKQNVRYAEVSVIPAIFTDNDMPFETLVAALNDGRDKALRAWNVEMNWILAIPRDRPRKADDIARWATSATARKGNVIALSLIGDETEQPIGQFRRAFGMAQKRELPRVTHAHSRKDAESLDEILQLVIPDRITDFWYGHDDEELMNVLSERDMPLVLTPSHERTFGRIRDLKNFPIRAYLERVPVLISSAMPHFYETNLVDELLAVTLAGDLNVDEIEEIVLNSVRYSFMDDERKQTMIAEFREQFTALRAEHLADA
jgi:adenosine deaminase